MTPMIQVPSEMLPAILDRCAQYDPNLVGRAIAELRAEALEQELRAAAPEGDTAVEAEE